MNLCDINGYTPLHAACINGKTDVVNSLLKYNSSVNLCNINGYTPLHFACTNGHTDVVQILLDNNCDIHSYKNKFDQHVIHIACEEGYKDNVEILIKHNVDINLCGGLPEHTPIQYACLKGHTDIVKLLLDNNCDVLDNNGLSPALHSGCKGGSVDIVDLLLRNKYNINQCQIVRKLGEKKKQTFDYMMYIHIYVLHSLFIRQITVKVYCYYCNRNNVCTYYFWKTLSSNHCHGNIT